MLRFVRQTTKLWLLCKRIASHEHRVRKTRPTRDRNNIHEIRTASDGEAAHAHANWEPRFDNDGRRMQLCASKVNAPDACVIGVARIYQTMYPSYS